MNKEHTKNLFDSGKILYSGRKLSLRENLMSFGFECGDGWFWPLMHLTENLEAINCLLKKQRIQIRAVQVKEKFGTLRFYYDVIIVPTWWQKITRQYFTRDQDAISRGVSNLVNLLVDKAEDECMGYCEKCGWAFFGDMRDRVETSGWISIICEKCAKEQNLMYKHFPHGKTWEQICKEDEAQKAKEDANKEKEKLDDSTGIAGEP